MHKGLFYPFHPRYWATEAWFWPRFVPWKLHLLCAGAGSFLPWSMIPHGTELISAAGVTSDDCKQVVYSFEYDSTMGHVVVEVLYEKRADAGVDKACYELTLSLDGTPIAGAVNFLDIPPLTVGGGFRDSYWFPAHDPAPPCTYTIRQATWEEAGSPY